MKHMCGCEHTQSQHHLDFGRCEQDCVDPDMGDFYTCPCPHFEADTDE